MRGSNWIRDGHVGETSRVGLQEQRAVPLLVESRLALPVELLEPRRRTHLRRGRPSATAAASARLRRHPAHLCNQVVRCSGARLARDKGVSGQLSRSSPLSPLARTHRAESVEKLGHQRDPPPRRQRNDVADAAVVQRLCEGEVVHVRHRLRGPEPDQAG